MNEIEESYEFLLVPDSKYETSKFSLVLTEIVENGYPQIVDQ